jgi:hypothetical protein
MTVDLERLADALKRDTPEKIIEQELEAKKQEIAQALREGREYVLDSQALIIKNAS